MVFTVDGREYKVRVDSLKRSGVVTDGENAGRLAVSLLMVREIIGTFYNYTLTINTDNLDFDEYDALYETLTDPSMDSHVVRLPYAQGHITFDAYITQVDDNLRRSGEGFNWWDGMAINFVAMRPQREAD